MRTTRRFTSLLLALASGLLAATHGTAQHVLENAFIRREISIADDHLRTLGIENKLTGAVISPDPAPEFRLRLSEGTHLTDPDTLLDAGDFEVTSAVQSQEGNTEVLRVVTENTAHDLQVEVRYSLGAQDKVLRKTLIITSSRTAPQWVIERIDIELLGIADAYLPYTEDAITANAASNWSPNLGQPLYTSQSATFWGVEFPAGRNEIENGLLRVGYLRGMPLEANTAYTTWSAVVGVADDPDFIPEAFQEYIDTVRIRPLRLQTQYNSWFDYGGSVNQTKFANSVAKVHEELVEGRGVRPFSRYVIDDGWQDKVADWSDKVWKVNDKFDTDFSGSLAAAANASSELGLWLSPGCLFGASAQVAPLRAAGFEALDDWMSMAGPLYMQALEDRLVELAGQGSGFFKLDGLFGHLNKRNFELHGRYYGLPEMPQLGLDGLNSGSVELNDPSYNELKLYYLTAGAERLMEMFAAVAAVDPDTYIVISNGAWLSPWWLMHVDTVWMINAGDAANGSTRTQELVYRDNRYHRIFVQENTQFPLHSLFNHEPKKTSTGETQLTFRQYLYMNLSRGTGFVELYIKPFVLSGTDWNVLAEGMLWAETMFPAFKRARMHGGDPGSGEVYGYSGWTAEGGYLSLHNPSAGQLSHTFTLDRKLGMVPGAGAYHLSSPMVDSVRDLPATASFGDDLSVDLLPGEVRLLHFDRTPRDWSAIRALQQAVIPEIETRKVIKPVAITTTIAGDAGSSHLYLLDDNAGFAPAGLQDSAGAAVTLETGDPLAKAMTTRAYYSTDGQQESWTNETTSGQPVFVFDLTGGGDTAVDSAILWQYGNSGGGGANGAGDFEMILHTEAEGAVFDFDTETIDFADGMDKVSGTILDNMGQFFSFGSQSKVRYAALRITSNHGGNRYGLGEVRFSYNDRPLSSPEGVDDSGANSWGNGNYVAGNLINGSFVASLDDAPADTNNWVTNNSGPDYFASGTPPVLVFDMGADVDLRFVYYWAYSTGVSPAAAPASQGNSVKTFNLAFATEAEGSGGFGASITLNPTLNADPAESSLADGTAVPQPVQIFDLGETVNARYVRMTITDNYYGEPDHAGGDRVGFNEIAFGTGTPYQIWTADLDDPDPAADSDNGGLATGIEWVTGGEPDDGSDDASVMPTCDSTTDPDNFLYMFRRRDEAHADAKTTIVVEYGTDLDTWRNTADHGAADGVTIDDSVDLGGGFHEVTVAIPQSLAASAGRLFARLSVTVMIP